MKKYKVSFRLKTGGSLEVIIEAKGEYEAQKIVKVQYASAFGSFISIREVK